jgi:hypothetical protein
LDALKVGNTELLGNLMADDAVLIDAHGPANKAQVLKNVQDLNLRDYEMVDVKVTVPSKTSGVVTYEIKETGTSEPNSVRIPATRDVDTSGRQLSLIGLPGGSGHDSDLCTLPNLGLLLSQVSKLHPSDRLIPKDMRQRSTDADPNPGQMMRFC